MCKDFLIIIFNRIARPVGTLSKMIEHRILVKMRRMAPIHTAPTARESSLQLPTIHFVESELRTVLKLVIGAFEMNSLFEMIFLCVGGLRVLNSGKSPFHIDAIEAAALSFKNQYIDIYSNSWGAEDDGQSVNKPKDLAAEALVTGVKEGRKGKGSIFVFAAGNGGELKDNCNCDGYVNSIHTISVGAANEDGESITFSEPCSAIMTTALSGYDSFENQITTTDSGGTCTDTFSGTSAATPMVSAVIALALEVNSNLTWRDVQHIGEF